MRADDDAPERFGDVPAGHAICNLCRPPAPVPLAELRAHLRVEHDVDDEPATWPDGAPVIVDRTLEPDDFTRRDGGPTIDTVEGKRFLLAARCAQARLLVELLLPDTADLLDRDVLEAYGHCCDALLVHAGIRNWSNEDGE